VSLMGETKHLKIGEIAGRAGVSVRTLRYYEEIGLLAPSERTASGHRLYGPMDVQRLQQIRSLQQLGLNLSEVDALLRGKAISPQRIVADHLAQVQAQREALTQLENQLQHLAHLLDQPPRDDAQAVEVFLSTIEAIRMYEKYLDPDQLRDVNKRHEDASTSAQAEWNAVLSELRTEMNAGTSPVDPKVIALVERWHKAGAVFMPPDDAGVHAGVTKLFHENPEALEDHGLDAELFAYIGRSVAPAEHS
jgi:MerR family transcriptional regulator, thiopeptide resistance regulator